jgi:hypothetical protein
VHWTNVQYRAPAPRSYRDPMDTSGTAATNPEDSGAVRCVICGDGIRTPEDLAVKGEDVMHVNCAGAESVGASR